MTFKDANRPRPAARSLLALLAAAALHTVPAAAQPDAAQADPLDTAAAEDAVDASSVDSTNGDDATLAPDALTEESLTGDAALPNNWFEIRVTIEDLADAGDYATAIELSDLLLELAEAQYGPESDNLAQSHLLIAKLHRQSGDYAAAETSVLDAIGVYEAAEGPLTEKLIEPFLELGETYYADERYANALASYGEARTIGRRAYGLLNEDQLTIIDRMTDAALELNDFEEAQSLQLEALMLIERRYDAEAPEAIEARFDYAAWLREQRRYQQERLQYHEIMRIVSRAYGDLDLRIVRALRERANSFRVERNGDSLGLSGLRDALDIVRELPEPAPLIEAQVLRDLGDWDVAFSRVGARGSEYLEAWALLGRVENGDELRREWFEDLAIVYLAPLSPRGLSNAPDAAKGRVVVAFTVDTSGVTSDIEINESDPPGFKDAAVERQIRASRFRPRIVNGVLTSARRVLGLDFSYNPDFVD